MRPLFLPLALLALACSEPVDRVVVELFAERDADGNGSLTSEEFGVGPAVFAELDADGDGRLSAREAQASLDRWRRGPGRRGIEIPAGSRLLADRRYAADPGVTSDHQSLDLWRPEGGGPFPVVLVLHGGGWVIGDKAEPSTISNKVPFFNARGFALASANYRLSPGIKHPEHVRDVARAIAWIREHANEHDLDADRIVVIGHSSGAHLAALVATDPRWLGELGGGLDWIAGTILLDGTGYDLPKLMAEPTLDPRVREMVRAAFGNDELGWADGSPALQAGEDPAPVLLLHAAERALSTDQAEHFARSIRERGGVAYVTAVDHTHGSIDRDLGLPDAAVTEPVRRFVERRIGRPGTMLLDTPLGRISARLDHRRAPLTADNFHDHLLDGHLDDATFYRTVRDDNQPDTPITIDVIQGGLLGPDFEAELPFEPIAHETTDRTGLLHIDGAFSMARNEPGTAQTEFFVCVGGQPELDFGRRRNPDGQGFAVFGETLSGHDVIRAIHAAPADGQFHDPLIPIDFRAGYDDRNPALSPDGKWIAFDSDRTRDGRRRLFIVRPDGADLQPLLADALGMSHPAWSPDGKTLAFSWANEAGGSDISVVPFLLDYDPADVSVLPRRISAKGGVNDAPRFSPDGQWLAYRHDGEPWIARANGSDARPLDPDELAGWPIGGRVSTLAVDGHADLWLTRPRRRLTFD